MRLIIPMAGRGTRLRPHTHVTPKPLLPVVGKPMVERIVEVFVDVLPRKIDQAVFILGDFPREVNDQLTYISERHDIDARFVVQDEALGTAHAVQCASEFLEGEIVIVFADTLFYMEPGIDLDGVDVMAWTKLVDDPRRFGVAVKNAEGLITALVEKPAEPISLEALIGIYYVRDGLRLRTAIQHLLDHDIKSHGEYQVTDALDLLLKQGLVFKTAGVTDWLDCGTNGALMQTSRVIRERESDRLHHGVIEDSVLIDPVYVGPGARVVNSVVGPHVTLEAGVVVEQSVLRESIVFDHARIDSSTLNHSMIGRHATVEGREGRLNIGDHSAV